MLLFNTAPVHLESKFDGRIHTFAPGERKRLDKVEGEHIYFKLQNRGLVELPDTTQMVESKFDAPVIIPYIISGLRKRRLMLDQIVQNFRTMNKEREAMKLAADQPSDLVIVSVKEINEIDAKLKELKADDYKEVDAYLASNQAASDNTAQDIKNMEKSVSRVGQTGSAIVDHKKNGAAPKDNSKGGASARRTAPARA